MAPIPYALTYTTTLRGRTPKLVRCEQCSFEYVYLLEMTVAGEGTSLFFVDNEGARQRSAAQAESALQQNLDQGCEVVPCPGCGLVQQHMLPRAKALHLRWMRTAGLIALAAGGILALPAGIYTLIDVNGRGLTTLTTAALAAVGLALSAGLGLLIQRARLCRRYNPNDAPAEDRKRQGQQFAISKQEFLKDAGHE
jgi:hypothetical protein